MNDPLLTMNLFGSQSLLLYGLKVVSGPGSVYFEFHSVHKGQIVSTGWNTVPTNSVWKQGQDDEGLVQKAVNSMAPYD